MWYQDPADTYKAYERFLRKDDFKRAYKCLVTLQSVFPKDQKLLSHIIDFCYYEWKKPEIARKWLIRLIGKRSCLEDHAFLCHIEAGLGNIPEAKTRLKETTELIRGMRLPPAEERAALVRIKKLEEFIRYKERSLAAEFESQKDIPVEIPSQRRHTAKGQNRKTGTKTFELKQDPGLSRRSSQPAVVISSVAKQDSSFEAKDPSPEKESIPDYSIPLKITPFNGSTLKAWFNGSLVTLRESLLSLDFAYLMIQGEFNELLCFNTLKGIEKYWYQIETVKKVIKYFHGRVLLCDEVGLGKTIEAGMLIKEYLMRHMAKSVLILTPPALVSQWKEEMQVKFGLEFKTIDDADFSEDPGKFWKARLIIASIHTAKNQKNLPLIAGQFYDIVVVDEAHHLRNRATQTWKAVNVIQKKFIFLLTATPVQNNLIELFNLITLLRPGLFKTEQVFKKEFLMKGNVRKPADKDKFRELLKDVMIRNTRSAIDLKLPKRFATTLRLEPVRTEREIYARLDMYVRSHALNKATANLLLREVGSSPFALHQSLSHMPSFKEDGEIKEIIALINDSYGLSKGRALVDLIGKNPQEKKIIFTQYLESMKYIESLLKEHGYPFVTFNGALSAPGKDAAIQHFKEDVPVLISTESGGEGRNIQFCNTIINFDLPWNPMRIEQRIGRLHRIGQTRDVFIFNLSVRETLEDYIIEILDSKINMFEMVIGEIEPIIGHIDEDRDFEEIIMEIWMNNKDEKSLKEGFDQFGNELMAAKNEYLRAKELDEEIFGEDYET